MSYLEYLCREVERSLGEEAVAINPETGGVGPGSIDSKNESM